MENVVRKDRKSTRLNSSHQIISLSLHDALPISRSPRAQSRRPAAPRSSTSSPPLPPPVSRLPTLLVCSDPVLEAQGPPDLVETVEQHLPAVGLHGECSAERSEEHTSELQSPDHLSFPTRRSSDLAITSGPIPSPGSTAIEYVFTAPPASRFPAPDSSRMLRSGPRSARSARSRRDRGAASPGGRAPWRM